MIEKAKQKPRPRFIARGDMGGLKSSQRHQTRLYKPCPSMAVIGYPLSHSLIRKGWVALLLLGCLSYFAVSSTAVKAELSIASDSESLTSDPAVAELQITFPDGKTAGCSGAIFADPGGLTRVATAGHCLQNPSGPARTITANAGQHLENGSPVYQDTCTTNKFAIAPNAPINGVNDTGSIPNDYGVITGCNFTKLSKSCLFTLSGDDAGSLSPPTLSLTGYPANRPLHTQVTKIGDVLNEFHDKYVTTHKAYFGDSGGPLANSRKVYGVQSYTFGLGNQTQYNVVPRFTVPVVKFLNTAQPVQP